MPSPRTHRRDLLALLTLLLVVKGWFILSIADVFLYGEELEKGTAAKAMLDGLSIAHHQLAYHYYEGGGFLISHLKALAFALVGQNLLAHKLLGLFTCASVLALGWRLLAHHCGRRAALYFGLLLIFGPRAAQKLSLLSLGIHFEAMVFGILILDQGLRLIQSPPGSPLQGKLLRLGVLAGFGLFFSYQIALFIAWMALLFLVMRPSLVFSRGGLTGLFGFALGALPLIVMATLVGTRVIDVHGHSLVGEGGRWELLTAFFRSVYSERSGFGLFTRVVYPAAGLVILVLGWRRGTTLARCLAGMSLFWLVAWIGSGFILPEHDYAFDWMRMMPLWVVMILLAAHVLARAGRAGAIALSLVCLLGAFNSAGILSEARPWSPLAGARLLANTKGYHYMGYFPKILGHLPGTRMEQMRILLQFDEPDPELLRADLVTLCLSDRPVDVAADLGFLRELDSEHYLDLVRGLGKRLVRGTSRDIRRALRAADGMGGELGDRLAESVGRVGRDWKVSPESISREIVAYQDAPRAASYLEGTGARILRSFVVGPGFPEYFLNLPATRAFIESQPPSTVPHLLRGLEAEWARWQLDPTP